MWKLRLGFVLPVVQIVIAVILLQLDYRTAAPYGSDSYVPAVRWICRGLNAPALTFRMLHPYFWGVTWDWVPRYILGFVADDFLLLVGVAVVWYFVGRAVDKRRSGEVRENQLVIRLAKSAFLLALGGTLALAGLREWSQSAILWLVAPGRLVGALLILIWAASLITISCIGIVRVVRQKARD
jgi:hypothetical protein